MKKQAVISNCFWTIDITLILPTIHWQTLYYVHEKRVWGMVGYAFSDVSYQNRLIQVF